MKYSHNKKGKWRGKLHSWSKKYWSQPRMRPKADRQRLQWSLGQWCLKLLLVKWWRLRIHCWCLFDVSCWVGRHRERKLPRNLTKIRENIMRNFVNLCRRASSTVQDSFHFDHFDDIFFIKKIIFLNCQENGKNPGKITKKFVKFCLLSSYSFWRVF